MDNWIIYEHISPSGKVYVGITSQNIERRWKNGMGYASSPYFFGAIVKYGWINITHNIIASNLGEMTAKNMEKDLIKFYKEQGKSYNITDGGDGVSGIKYDDKHNQNVSRVMRLYYKSHDHPLTGFKHSRESIERMKVSQKNRWTPELRAKASNKHKKPIVIIDIKTGEVIRYESRLSAINLSGISKETIQRRLKDGLPFKGKLIKYESAYLNSTSNQTIYNKEDM